jgi:hypothetical protein
MKSVTLVHSSSHLSTLVSRHLGDRKASYFPPSYLFLVGLGGAKWDLSLMSRACATRPIERIAIDLVYLVPQGEHVSIYAYSGVMRLIIDYLTGG